MADLDSANIPWFKPFYPLYILIPPCPTPSRYAPTPLQY